MLRRPTHDYTYGGQLWFKFLIAVGAVPERAVNAANLVIEFRSEHKEHRGLDAATRERTSQRLVRRAARASTPGEGEGAELPRQMRRRW